MTDATTEFFEALAGRGHDPGLARISGTLRFDVLEGGKRTSGWHISIRRGDISVSRRNAKADCVVRGERTVVEGVTSGEMNALAAVLRGAVDVQGDAELLLAFQHLFPGPPRRES